MRKKYNDEHKQWLVDWFEEHYKLGTQKELIPLIESDFLKKFGIKSSGLALLSARHRVKRVVNEEVKFILFLHDGTGVSGKMIACI